jgi:hypothetical protein
MLTRITQILKRIFSNLDVMIKGLYPNWSYSILYLPYSCQHILFVQLVIFLFL